MIKHIVFFRFKKEMGLGIDECCLLAAEKLYILSELSCIESLTVHKNITHSPYANYDLMVDCSFSSFEQLQKYQQHPQHEVFVQWLKTVITDRASVDYEI